MKPDWTQVTVEHIQRACEIYDSEAATPKRQARTAFLLLNGRTYPAKFIRGLAYRLATGIELDPNQDYSGGAETIKFLTGLGLTTRDDVSSDQQEVAGFSIRFAPAEPSMPLPQALESPIPSIPLPPALETLGSPRQHREPQKRALAALLCRSFGTIEMEAKFPWLTVPKPDAMDEELATIFNALKTMRGFAEFATPGKSLRCDFFVPSKNWIIEYDEQQHFTLQRAQALELYPADVQLGFDREEWLTICRKIKASDPTPPHRDEQRAFYDSLRDILAARNGIRLLRLRQGNYDWTGSSADEEFEKLFPTGKLSAPKQMAVASADAAPK